jgi:hypothetical protein
MFTIFKSCNPDCGKLSFISLVHHIDFVND